MTHTASAYRGDVFPLRDENPTTRRPIVTLAILALCAFAWFGPQQGLSEPMTVDGGELPTIDEQTAFTFEQAVIPCELTTGEALSAAEITSTLRGAGTCVDGDDPFVADKNVWLAAITSIFLHGSLMHLLGNLWFLWIFGNNIEDRLGAIPFTVFYLVGGVVATLGHVMVQPSSTIPLVGASGAIAAVMGAYAVWFPDAPIRTFALFALVDIRARWYLLVWFVFQFFTGSDSRVAWVAHVAGFVFGLFIAGVIRVTRPERVGPTRPDQVDVLDSTGGIGRGPLPHPSDRFRRTDGPFTG